MLGVSSSSKFVVGQKGQAGVECQISVPIARLNICVPYKSAVCTRWKWIIQHTAVGARATVAHGFPLRVITLAASASAA